MKYLIEAVLILHSVLLSVSGTEKVIYAQVGQSVTLTAPGGNQDKYARWYFVEDDKNHELGWINTFGRYGTIADKNWTLSLTGNSLTIERIQDKQFGKFFCEFSQGIIKKDKATFKLIKVKVLKPDSVLLPGESLSLDCGVETPRDRPTPDIHWLNPQGQSVKNTVSKTVEHEDNGSWTCVVGNDYKAQVSVPVVDLAAPERDYTSTDSRLTLPCSIPSYVSWEQIKQKGVQEIQWHFSPKPPSSPSSDEPLRLMYLSPESSLTWTTDQGKDLKPASDATKGSLSLYKNQAKVEDRGDYTCSMTFRNGVTLKRTVHVQVLQITPFPGAEIIYGQSVSLLCSTGEPLTSDLQLKWFPPERSTVPTSDRRGANLTIKEAGSGDSGQWRCELWRSDERLTSAALKLNIEPKLSMWMLVIICSAAIIPVLLFILTFILCRRHQQKKHPRHRLCQCRNPKPKGFYRT
ncbi:CD4-1 molecule isoform X1 [Salarias fasciatus]|uniref:CD4-1 molecule isoform X1 n=1 Tax=Salarias fasciatus TaxID=181472 RepID=UPI0011764B15|nr:uncharacterized protein LOC115396998 isoform X1 [Salarias fasciatus]